MNICEILPKATWKSPYFLLIQVKKSLDCFWKRDSNHSNTFSHFYITSDWEQNANLEFIKAVSDTVFDMINAAYYDKPLILISHNQAVNTNQQR